MKLEVHTRFSNLTLYKRMREFIPEQIKCWSHSGHNHYTDALWYLVHIINTAECEYIVNVDEDCYIYDWQKVEEIVDQMQRDGIAYTGMPDSLDYCDHRNNSDMVMNPFFNVFHVEQCRKVVSSMVVGELLAPNPYCNFHEPFNNFFIQLFESLPAGSIRTTTHPDGITTDTGFALHTWYSREYGNIQEETDRIDAVYYEAKERWKARHS